MPPPAFFGAECFGAPLQDGAPQNAADLSDADLARGQKGRVHIDAPWVAKVHRAGFAREPATVRAVAPDAPPFVGPDQAALEGMLAAMSGAA